MSDYKDKSIENFLRKWTEKPLYQLNKEINLTKKQVYSNKSLNFEDPNFRPSGPTMSPLVLWHEEEYLKMRRKEFNEIELNKIKAALMGVKNEFKSFVNKNIQELKALLIKPEKNWSKIMELRENA